MIKKLQKNYREIKEITKISEKLKKLQNNYKKLCTTYYIVNTMT